MGGHLDEAAGAGPSRPGRRRAALATAALLLAAAGAGLWWWLRPRPEPPLESGWDAAVFVLAGSGVPGAADGPPFSARFSDPFGVAAGTDGSVVVADAGDAQRIRRIAADGTVTTVAGGSPGFADGPALSARFHTPSGLAAAPDGSIYIADTGNNLIRRLSPAGVVATVAGALTPGSDDGPAGGARFDGPVGVAVDRAGRVIVADTYNDRIRRIASDGTVSTLAGAAGAGYVDGPPESARFDTPCGVAVDGTGTIYVADAGNGVVRAIAPDGHVTTVQPMPPDGLVRPVAVAVTAGGTVYVTDDRGRVIEIVPGQRVRVVAGSRPGFADGPGAEARFRGLSGIAVAGEARLVVADTRNALVRLVAAPAKTGLRPPAPPAMRPSFDADAFAREPLLWPIAPMDGPFEVTGTLGEPRGGEGGERFHAGVDIRADEGVPVRAVRPGTVSSPAAAGDVGTLNESIRIGPLAYVHLKVGRDRQDVLFEDRRFAATRDETGRLTGVRVRRGARFSTGEAIGTANRFNHVHLNIGWPGEEHNPLRFRLVQFGDHVPPTIVRGGVRLFREDGTPLTARARGRLLVEGRVRIVVDAWDHVDGNGARRRLGLYALGYQVLDRRGVPLPGFEQPRETIRFDRLQPGSDAARIVYASGSGIPFYGGRSTRLLYVVTSTLAGGQASLETWDAGALPPGDYVLRIHAADAAGNAAVANRDVALTIVRPADAAPGP